MINAIEYGKSVLIKKEDYDEDDRLYLNSIKEHKFEITETKEGINIKPLNYVGTIQLSRKRINIKPRFDEDFKKLIDMIIFTENINFKFMKKDTDTSQSNNDLIEVVILLFLNEVESIFKGSLLKGYTDRDENLSVIRGRINFQNHLTKNYLQGEKIYCNFEELDYDNTENQVILKALKVAFVKTNNISTKKSIKRYIQILKEYCKIYENNKFPDLKYTRLNNRYQEVHYYCKILINELGAENLYTDGKFRNKYNILIDMNNLFERFVTKIYKLNLTDEYELIPQYRVSKAIVDEYNNTYVDVKPDIVLLNKESNEYTIIDVKNKNYGNKKVSNSDIYQLSFYGMYFSNMFKNKVNIVIAYPRYSQQNLKVDNIFLRGINSNSNYNIELKEIDINFYLDKYYKKD